MYTGRSPAKTGRLHSAKSGPSPCRREAVVLLTSSDTARQAVALRRDAAIDGRIEGGAVDRIAATRVRDPLSSRRTSLNGCRRRSWPSGCVAIPEGVPSARFGPGQFLGWGSSRSTRWWRCCSVLARTSTWSFT